MSQSIYCCGDARHLKYRRRAQGAGQWDRHQLNRFLRDGGFKGCAQLLGELTRFNSTEKETEWESHI